MPQNRINLKSYRYSPHGRNIGENSYNSGDETDQMAQSLIFVTMMMMMISIEKGKFRVL
jgi:hypothetical protein